MNETPPNSVSGSPLRSSRLDYHTARILLLIASYTRIHEKPLDGLTKLAKLDFLVRYPIFLQQLTEKVADQSLPDSIKPTDAERLGVESRMVRYKYGPWDDRYYPILGTLIGLNLITPTSGRGRVALSVTGEGAIIAESLAGQESWALIASRCSFVVDVFDMPGSRLKETIYRELPAVTSTRYRLPI